jgi:hypothetical protein
MAVIHADRPVSITEPDDVDPRLRLELAKRTFQGTGVRDGRDIDRLGEFVNAPVVVGVRQRREFQAHLKAESAQGAAEIRGFADIAMREVDGTRAVVLRCHASELTVALITVLDPEHEQIGEGNLPMPVLHWSLTPRSADAMARADLLDFLREIHKGGHLQISDADTGERMGRLVVPGGPFDRDLEQDWHFLSDVATLEEWAGMSLPLPAEVSAVEVDRIQQAAEMVRTRRVVVGLSSDISTTVTGELEDADELQLEQDFGVEVFGYDVPLGTGLAHIQVSIIDQTAGEKDGESHVTFRLSEPEQQISFELRPPDERMPYKRTLLPDEAPPPVDATRLPTDWMDGEREADQELRNGGGIRFSSEDAFFEWLENPDEAPAD